MDHPANQLQDSDLNDSSLLPHGTDVDIYNGLSQNALVELVVARDRQYEKLHKDHAELKMSWRYHHDKVEALVQKAKNSAAPSAISAAKGGPRR